MSVYNVKRNEECKVRQQKYISFYNALFLQQQTDRTVYNNCHNMNMHNSDQIC